jgi:hypothetical protein
MSVQNFASASPLPIAAGAISLEVSPGAAPPPVCEPSFGVIRSSGEPAVASSNSSASASGLIFWNSGEMS